MSMEMCCLSYIRVTKLPANENAIGLDGPVKPHEAFPQPSSFSVAALGEIDVTDRNELSGFEIEGDRQINCRREINLQSDYSRFVWRATSPSCCDGVSARTIASHSTSVHCSKRDAPYCAVLTVPDPNL